MKLRGFVALLAVLALGAGSASAQTIGLYWDTSGAVCNGVATPGSPGTAYILAILSGPATGGITGAEFRLDNWPPSWFTTVTPNPASNVMIGNPITGALPGVNLAFPACQPGAGGIVNLFTISYFVMSMETNRFCSILKHSSPANPAFQCPALFLCDAPVFSEICANGGQGVINGEHPCTVAVQAKTWSQVKGLFH